MFCLIFFNNIPIKITVYQIIYTKFIVITSTMKRFVNFDKIENNMWWDICLKKQIPYVCIKNKIKFSVVSFDAFPMLQNYELLADPSNKLAKLYYDYAKLSSLPSNQFNCTGSSTCLSFTIWKKDAETFANSIYSFIEPFIKSNREPFKQEELKSLP